MINLVGSSSSRVHNEQISLLLVVRSVYKNMESEYHVCLTNCLQLDCCLNIKQNDPFQKNAI